MDFPGGSDVKESACNTGDPGSIPGSERSSGEGNGNPFQYSCLENPMDGGAWQATVHGVAESDTTEWLDFYMLASGHNAGDTHTHTHRVLRHARKWMSVWEDMNHTRENLEKILSVTAIFVIAWWGTTVNKTMKFLLTVYRGQCGKAVCPAGHPGVSLWFSGVWL